VVIIDTDAPVPTAPGASVRPAATNPAVLFDAVAVRIELVRDGDPQSCTTCTVEREFALDDEHLRRGTSFTVQTSPEARPLVHVQMFRAATVAHVGFRPSEIVSVWARLPQAPREGAIEATVMLPTDAVGSAQGSREQPLDLAPGRSSSRVGTWPGAARIPCTEAPREGEVCIPGGAFWMGNAIDRRGPTSADRSRLVVLAPFFLGAHEVTVAEMRQVPRAEPRPTFFSGVYEGSELEDFCTYTATPAEHESLPVNCVTWSAARAYCRAHGGDLATEAQHEYVNSALQSFDYIWGRDLVTCDAAVWGRGGGAPLSAVLAADSSCIPKRLGPGITARDLIGYPRASDRQDVGRDELDLPTGRVRDLAGNLEEWALDYFQTQDEPCWSQRAGALVDPVCSSPGKLGPLRAVRGASWTSTRGELLASTRFTADPSTWHPRRGFRCARPSP